MFLKCSNFSISYRELGDFIFVRFTNLVAFFPLPEPQVYLLILNSMYLFVVSVQKEVSFSFFPSHFIFVAGRNVVNELFTQLSAYWKFLHREKNVSVGQSWINFVFVDRQLIWNQVFVVKSFICPEAGNFLTALCTTFEFMQCGE